jgi:hypothetical protein
MRYINVRQLLSNLNEEVKDLPITVTRYGKPYLLIDAVPSGTKPKRIEFVEDSGEEPKETVYSSDFVD